MKRFFAILMCSIIILLHFVPVIPGQAAEVVIEQGIDILYKGWDMINSLINGGVIQTSPYQGIADQGTALAAFYDDWGENLLKVINYAYGATDIGEAELSAIGLSYPIQLGMSGSYYNNFVSEYVNLIQDVNNGFAVPLTGDSLAAWNRYNNLFINKYINAFTPDVEIPTPDVNYSSYLDMINGVGFWNTAIFDYGGINNAIYSISGASNYSYVTTRGNSASITNNLNQYNESGPIFVFAPMTFDIVGSGDVYSLSLRNSAIDYSFMKTENNQYFDWNYYAGTNKVSTSQGRIVNEYTFNNYWAYPSSYFNFSGNLTQCLNWLTQHTRNITLYVNGQLWLQAGDLPESLVDYPDVIRNETGQIIGNDVMFPTQDLMVDLINWQNLLQDKIGTGEDITFDDLIDGGVITDGNGDVIDQNDVETLFKKRDIAGVIGDTLEDADAIGFVPNAPEPPDIDPGDWNFPEFPLPDIDGGFDTPRVTGLSVLARIVNVTNKSLPPELITMFWGICITLVILGIIKILHK